MEIPWETFINLSPLVIKRRNINMIGIYKITNKETGKSYIG
jgi:hypothetical protein